VQDTEQAILAGVLQFVHADGALVLDRGYQGMSGEGAKVIFVPAPLFCMENHSWNIQGRMKVT
jgi:hypothetical protein